LADSAGFLIKPGIVGPELVLG